MVNHDCLVVSVILPLSLTIIIKLSLCVYLRTTTDRFQQRGPDNPQAFLVRPVYSMLSPPREKPAQSSAFGVVIDLRR
ncbi:hypothetical protein B0J13DRAFT_543592 [Dactylonectria estremocensis]|uniref:Uncharacterized protein n=1 Tax=Dactylonectria estremocensis TaxID=1079267 RepID=A0A9P9FCZ2_9HYPO|nr:hypothetical protein B0J13DRAFT_543592 [Dactylonectria estremocensis]